jgi:hypothetical protein
MDTLVCSKSRTIQFIFAGADDRQDRIEFLEWCWGADAARIVQLRDQMGRLRSPERIARVAAWIAARRQSMANAIKERRALRIAGTATVYFRTAGLRYAGQHCARCNVVIDGIEGIWVRSVRGEQAVYCADMDCHAAAEQGGAR